MRTGEKPMPPRPPDRERAANRTADPGHHVPIVWSFDATPRQDRDRPNADPALVAGDDRVRPAEDRAGIGQGTIIHRNQPIGSGPQADLTHRVAKAQHSWPSPGISMTTSRGSPRLASQSHMPSPEPFPTAAPRSWGPDSRRVSIFFRRGHRLNVACRLQRQERRDRAGTGRLTGPAWKGSEPAGACETLLVRA